MPGLELDGNDVGVVCEAAREAVERARSGGGPTLIECKTYRILGHHEGDPGIDYRTKEEVEAWKRRCPLRASREKLLETGAVSEDTLKKMEGEIALAIEEAVGFSRSSPQPSPDTLFDHLF
jgi:2-oxoisovalerate dehydrogenase E1 component